MEQFIGIDLGGTNIKAIVVDKDGGLKEEHSRPTCDGEFEGPLPRFAVEIRKLIDDLEKRFGPAAGVGISAPGLATGDERAIFCIPGKMQGLEGLDWVDFLKRDSPVAVLNDAHAALLGETWVGAAVGKIDVVMLTLGTGVGGAIMCDGRLLKGHIGRAGHLGHLSVGADLPPDDTGVPGGLEMSISETFIKTLDHERFRSTRDLAEAARSGDSEAVRIWEESVRRLAVGISSIINAADPEIMIIGGGAARAGDFLFGLLDKYLTQYEWRPQGHRVTIVPARLDANAGAYGAARAVLLRER